MGASSDELSVPRDTFFWILAILLGGVVGSALALSLYGVILFVSLLILHLYTSSQPIQLDYDFTEEKFKGWTEEEVQYDFHRRAKEQPPQPFPNGWAIALDIRQLPVGGKTAFMTFGKELLFFRGKTSHLVHQRCPNSGDDLEKGGTIQGDAIFCRSCSTQNEQGCGASAGEFRELHGLLYLWYHSDDLPPTWEPTNIPDLNENDLMWKGTGLMMVACHPQDLLENTADDGHINPMHCTLSMTPALGAYRSWIDYRKIIRMDWGMQWMKTYDGAEMKLEGEKARVTSYTTSSTTMNVFGLPLKTVPGLFINEGPYYCTFNFTVGGRKVTIILAACPVDSLRTQLINSAYGGKFTPLVPRVLAEDFHQVLRDGIVWNSKVHRRNPIWVKEWQMMKDWRRWYSQFYTNEGWAAQHNQEADKAEVKTDDVTIL